MASAAVPDAVFVKAKSIRARSANCVQAQPGRGEETRTPDILLPKQARYQLRYTSIKSQRFQTAFYCNGFPPRSQGNPAEFRGFPERNCRMGRGIRSTAQIPNRETEAPAYRHTQIPAQTTAIRTIIRPQELSKNTETGNGKTTSAFLAKRRKRGSFFLYENSLFLFAAR